MPPKKLVPKPAYKPVESPQEALFDEDWRAEWQGMPEFVQEKARPYAQVIVRFATKEDHEDFCKLIGQPFGHRTKSIWHPKLVRGFHAHKRYRDES